MSKNVWHAVKMLLWGNLQINAYTEKKKMRINEKSLSDIINKQQKQETKQKSRMWEIMKIKTEINKVENKLNDILLRNIYITFYTLVIYNLGLIT